ncbi:MAG: hypothetical protein GY856_38620 [bacterium]|nr:hypothetical protein [bacterium]
MPFQYTLANLLAQNDGAIAVLFLDDTGETVDLACADFTPYDMKVVGAYIGICVQQLGAMLNSTRLGTFQMLHIEKDAVHLFATALPDGYFLVLVQRRPALVAKARESLKRARAELARAIFDETKT